MTLSLVSDAKVALACTKPLHKLKNFLIYMEISERSVDRLSRYAMIAAVIAGVCAVCWLLRGILVYIIVAAVVSFIGRPIMKILRRLLGKYLPDWLLTLVTLLILSSIFIGLFTQIIPVIYSIIRNISDNMRAASLSAGGALTALDGFNGWVMMKFPDVGENFNIQESIVNLIKGTFNLSSVSAILGSLASTAGNIGIGFVSVLFISFFFIKDENLFRRIVGSLVSDKIEGKAIETIGEIESLISRYFLGLLLEVLIVTALNFLGLWAVARLGFSAAIGIAFISGLLNIIPYVGPWIGAGIGGVLGLILRFSGAAAIGESISLGSVLLIILGCFIVTQIIDNFLLQPLIYSASVKSSPLEIFIVLLLAGQLWGIAGMLVAIPAYTVARIIASRFFGNIKAIRRLTGEPG